MADFIVLRNSKQQANWAAYQTYLSGHAGTTPTTWLVTSGSSGGFAYDFGFRFQAQLGTWKPITSKRLQTMEVTFTGKRDVSVGPILKSVAYSLTIRYLYSSPELIRTQAYLWTLPGDYADLYNLFILNNPMASPSNSIWLVDHYEADIVTSLGDKGFLVGDHLPEPFTTVISGLSSYYTIPISFEYYEDVA